VSRRGACLVPLAMLLLVGCVLKENLPAHPRMPAEQTRQALAQRAEAVKTVSAEGTITLTRKGGQSIRFDGAMAIRPPDHSRLRAWKFGQAVFDLTVTPDGVWIIAPDDPDRRDDIRRAGNTAADFGRTFSSLLGSYFSSSDLDATEDGNLMRFRQNRPDGTSLTSDVDRRTLTPRRYKLIDPSGRTRFQLVLDRYKLVDDIPWPRRITADSDTGRIQIELRDIELNVELPAAAFTPPKRAEKLK
jgi:outer membrane lipoprotein-sorting protein